jgi:hypothetical protein
MKSSIKNLIDTLESDCKELEEMVIDRIKSSYFSDEGLREALIEDPFTLELSFEDIEGSQLHSYDVGRKEAFEEIIRSLKEIINEKHKV